jgi:hypothetical protein
VSGVTVVLPVDDDGFDEADWLADALADDEALFLGVADLVAEAEGEATVACAGAGLVQVEFGVGWSVFLPVPSEVRLGLGLGDTVWVGVPLGLLVGLTLALELLLALAEALVLALALVVPPLLWLPLDDVAGAVVLPVVLLAGLLLVTATDECVDGDGQELGVV